MQLIFSASASTVNADVLCNVFSSLTMPVCVFKSRNEKKFVCYVSQCKSKHECKSRVLYSSHYSVEL